MTAAVWRVSITLPGPEHLPAFEAALEPFGGAVTTTELGADGARGTGQWQLIVYGLASPDRAALTARISLAAGAEGIDVPPSELTPMPEIDWVAQVASESVPIEAGRFFVHGSHYTGAVPAGKLPILIDATRAFGSGTHESTRGCLTAMDRLLIKGLPGKVLDLGTGSAILAIAAAKAGVTDIVASDNDPIAVGIAQENIELNGVDGSVRTLVSQGFRNTALRKPAPYDWILANILAEPLIRLAPPIVRHLRAGGMAVLAGFLVEQAERVEAAYRREGATAIDRIDLNGWRTLVVARS